MILKNQNKNNIGDVYNFPRILASATVSHNVSHSVRHKLHTNTTGNSCYDIFRVINDNISVVPIRKNKTIDEMIAEYKFKYDIE
jgi:hypothetical protein